MKRFIVLTLFILVARVVLSQTYCQLVLQVDGKNADCIRHDEDVVWTVTNERTGKSCDNTNTGDWYCWGDAGPGCFTLNLQELEGEGAFKAGDKFTIKVQVKSMTCYAGYSGVESYIYDGGQYVQTKDDPIGYAYLQLKAPQATLTVTGTILCEGETGKQVTAALTNMPADLTNYEIDWGNPAITTASLEATKAVANVGDLKSTFTGHATLKKKADHKEVATSNEYTVTVNPLPVISLSSESVCAGGEITFKASGGNAFSWSGDVTGTKSSVKKAFANAGQTDYKVTVENTTTKCSASKTGKVEVHALPEVTTLIAAVSDVCKDAQATLTATATGGGGGYTYVWSNGTQEQTGSLKPVVASAGANKYSVKVTDKNKCSSAASKEVTVTGHAVTVQIDGPASANYGEAVDLTAKPQFNPQGATADSYQWTGKIDGPDKNAKITTQALTGNADYQVTVKDNYGCSATSAVKTVSITGSALDIHPTGGGAYCSAELPLTLKAGVSGGSGTKTYLWKATPAGLTLAGENTESLQITAGNEGRYDIELTVQAGKEKKMAHVEVEIKASPVLSDLKADPAAVTVGDASQLSVKVAPANAVCTWTGTPAPTPITGTTVSTGVLADAKTYVYKVKAEHNGCFSAEETVRVVAAGDNQIAIVLPVAPPSGIVDQPIDVKVDVTGGSGHPQFQWTTNEGGVTVTDNGNGQATVIATTPGVKNICVTVTDNGKTAQECFDVIVSDNTVNLVMTVDEKCAYPGEKLTITVVGNGADSYSFTLRDQANNAVLTVRDQKAWNPYQVSTAAAGIYKITDFKYKLGGKEYVGTPPAPVKAFFNPIPNVYAMADQRPELVNCQGDMVTLTASGEPGLQYTWDHGVVDGVPFVPMADTYKVTGKDPVTGCVNTSSVLISIHPKPQLTVPGESETCEGELITLTATGTGADRFVWDNGVDNGVPFRATQTTTYQVRAIDDAFGCEATGEVTVTVNPKTRIARTSRNPRNIAIDKDVYFAVTAVGDNLSYRWQRKENNMWVNLQNGTTGVPAVVGADTDSLRLMNVPEDWNGSEFKCIVSGNCGKDSTEFQLEVKECFAIEAELVLMAGITPDEDPGNRIDGWYCRGQEIAVKAVISSEEGYSVENAHYKWSIDGLELPEEHVEVESDTAVLTWIPQFQEEDIVIKVCVYCDGACEEVCAKYIRLKAREFQDVSMRILSDCDPLHRFCAGDTVNFWIAAKNAGENPQFTWYNDVFQLPDKQSPKNELIRYENDKLTLRLGQEDTWMRVVMTPSPDVCTREPNYVDTAFLKVKNTVHPQLSIWCEDTLACLNDSIRFEARWEDAGENPSFQWTRSIGYPYWDLGTDHKAVSILDDQDMWIKCELKPSQDVCYDTDTTFADVVHVKAIADPKVTIAADLAGKKEGDEVIVESDITGMPIQNPRYTWYIDDMIAKEHESELIRSDFQQGDKILLGVQGDWICQNQVLSNVLEINFNGSGRDTLFVIYAGEAVRNASLAKDGDEVCEFFIQRDGYTGNAKVTMGIDGLFNYIPDMDFTGKEKIVYKVVNRYTGRAEIGYVYVEVRGKEKFFVPNIITPNNDGLNDTWKLDFLSAYPDHVITVYNRDGKIVFRADHYQNDWDGTGKGSSGYVAYFNLSNGIYTYVIDLGNKEILKGWLEIRRDMNLGKYSR